MNKLKLSLLSLALCGGLTAVASANISGPITQDVQPDNPTATLDAFNAISGHEPATACIERIDGNRENGTDVTSGAFSFHFQASANGGQEVVITFNLTGSGQVLCGFYIKGGSQGGNFYIVEPDQGVSGTFTVNAPVTGKSGKFAGISHIDVFCCEGGTNVPDGGTTVMLLGSALTGLGLLRRYIKS